MNRLLVLVSAVVLVAAACTSSSDTASTTSATTATATTQPVTTQPPTTTTTAAPTTTTTAAPTTTVNAGAAALAAIAGTYGGSWTNTTFGSTGAIAMTIDVSDTSEVTIGIDIDGFVFGASNPDIETYTFPGADLGTGAVVASPTFGPTTISASVDGLFMLEANEVPSPGIESISIVGRATGTGFSGEYTIVFDDGGGAEGVFDMSTA